MSKRFTVLSLGLSIFLVLGVVFLSIKRDKTAAFGEFSLSSIEFKSVRIIYKNLSSLEDIEEVNCDSVKPVVYSNIDLRRLSAEKRKMIFINSLLPSALIANHRVAQERENLLRILAKIREGKSITELEQEYIEYLLSRYKARSVEELLDKVNTVPVSLLLAQAAIESGWGKSRAFRVANNSFGMWTFKEEHPHIRVVGTNIKLRRFENLLESVENYIYTLNVGWAYNSFRQKRFFTDNPLKLADSLRYYSIQRDRYVKKIKLVILSNNLERYDNCKLDSEYIF